MARTVRREKTDPVEKPFAYEPSAPFVPAADIRAARAGDPAGESWAQIADIAMTTPGAAQTSEQRILRLLADTPACRAELTVIAGGA